jgi:hypothetical protein
VEAVDALAGDETDAVAEDPGSSSPVANRGSRAAVIRANLTSEPARMG